MSQDQDVQTKSPFTLVTHFAAALTFAGVIAAMGDEATASRDLRLKLQPDVNDGVRYSEKPVSVMAEGYTGTQYSFQLASTQNCPDKQTGVEIRKGTGDNTVLHRVCPKTM